MDRPLPWRVLEDGAATDLPARPSAAGTARANDTATTPGGGPARRVLALAVAAAAALMVGALVLVLGGSTSPALVLPAASLPPLEMSRLGAGASAEAGDASGGAAVVVVDVAGAVRRPGVYRLPEGSRVIDAIAAAGGYGPRVDAVATSHLNLAAPVRDGEQVRVPSRDDPPAAGGGAAPVAGAGSPAGGASSGGASSGSGGGAPVNLNTASAEELDTLPGVGPVTAAKIIAAREEAPFAAVADLRSRGVVGEATFRKLESLVTVGP
jgi:competence protein ComEA